MKNSMNKGKKSLHSPQPPDFNSKTGVQSKRPSSPAAYLCERPAEDAWRKNKKPASTEWIFTFPAAGELKAFWASTYI